MKLTDEIIKSKIKELMDAGKSDEEIDKELNAFVRREDFDIEEEEHDTPEGLKKDIEEDIEQFNEMSTEEKAQVSFVPASKVKASKLTEGVNKEEVVDELTGAIMQIVNEKLDDFNPELEEDTEFVKEVLNKTIKIIKEAFYIEGKKIKAKEGNLYLRDLSDDSQRQRMEEIEKIRQDLVEAMEAGNDIIVGDLYDPEDFEIA